MSSMHLDFFQPVGPKAGTATTQVDPNAAQQQGNGQGTPPMGGCAGGGMTWIMMLAIVPMLFLMFRRQKKEQEARGKLKEGDKVVSNSGLVGTLMSNPAMPIVKVKIAPGTTVEMMSQTVSPFVEPTAAPAAKGAKDGKDDKKAAAAELATSKPVPTRSNSARR